MIIYAFIAIMPLLFSVFFPKMNEYDKRKRRYLTLCGIVLILFIGLRSRFVGSEDSFNYYNMMRRALLCESWQEYFDPDYVEEGFQLLVYVLSRIFNSAQFLFIVSGIIFVVAVCYCIYKNSENVVLSMTMYVTLGIMQFQLQGMRQAIAMAICMVSFEFVKKKKLIPFALLVILAMQFHRTAVVIAAIYVVSILAYNVWSIILLAICSGVVFAYTDQLMAFANDLFETDYSQTIDSGGFIATAIYVLIIVFAMIFYRKEMSQKKDKTASTIMFVTILGFVSYIMRYFGVLISERISFYFMFGQLLLLPNAIKKMPAEYRKVVEYAVSVLCIALFLYRIRGSAFVPYQFFWQNP